MMLVRDGLNMGWFQQTNIHYTTVVSLLVFGGVKQTFFAHIIVRFENRIHSLGTVSINTVLYLFRQAIMADGLHAIANVKQTLSDFSDCRYVMLN